MARVVVIEDDERVRRALEAVFRGRAEMLAYTTLAAARADEHVPRDAMIIDHGLPDGDGLAYALSVAERYPAIPITLFTGHTWSEVGRHASAAGIGFAEKPDGISQIHRLAEYLEARPRDEAAVTAARLDLLKQRAPGWRLSARERDAARLAVEGLARDAMATRLGIGPGSVKNLVTRLLRKCGFASLAALVASLDRA